MLIFLWNSAGGLSVATGLATESDTALALPVVKLRATGVASETDTALGLAAVKLRATGTSTETDTALAPSVGNVGASAGGYFGATFFGPEHFASDFYRVDAVTQTIAVGTATETDTALAPVVGNVSTSASGYFGATFFAAKHYASDFYRVDAGAVVVVPPGPQPDVGQRVTFWTRDDYREWKAERRKLAAKARKLKKKLATVAEDAPDELAARVATLQRAKVKQDDISGLRDLVEHLELLIAAFVALRAAEDAEEDDIEILLLAA